MESPLPPDPYTALGVAKDAESTAIKSVYRKLVLKCHPDKFPDPDVKAQKAEEFHKIQQAYELLVDDQRRSRYDQQVRLAELRKEALERQSRGGSGGKGEQSYNTRTAVPKDASRSSKHERKSSRREEDFDRYDEPRTTSRKDAGHEARRSTRERESHRHSKENDRSRSDRKKEASKAERRDRSAKYAYVEEEDSEKERARYEEAVRQRNERYEEMRRQAEADRIGSQRYAAQAEEIRRKSEETARRVVREKSSRESDYADEADQKFRNAMDIAKNYIDRASEPRTSSGRESSKYEVRRSSARPRESRNREHRDRDRERDRDQRERKGAYPEIVEFAASPTERRPPTLRASESSPAQLKIPRSYTFQSGLDRDEGLAPPPSFRRVETMPNNVSFRQTRKGSLSGSSPRHPEAPTPQDSGYSSPPSPEYSSSPYSSSKQPTATRYLYDGGAGGVSRVPDDRPTYRTIVREPGISPSRGRGRDREVERSSSARYSNPPVVPDPPKLSASNSYKTELRRPTGSDERLRKGPPAALNRSITAPIGEIGRSSYEDVRSRQHLFGEVVGGVSYSRSTPFNLEDVSWSASRQQEPRLRAARTNTDFSDHVRPTMRYNENVAY